MLVKSILFTENKRTCNASLAIVSYDHKHTSRCTNIAQALHWIITSLAFHVTNSETYKAYRQTGRQNRQTDRQTDRQPASQPDKQQASRQASKQ